jgi:hypothetical protein
MARGQTIYLDRKITKTKKKPRVTKILFLNCLGLVHTSTAATEELH